MHTFLYTAQQARVVFGSDAWTVLKAEAGLLGARKVLVLCTARQRTLAQRAVDALGECAAGIFDQAVMHVPVAAVRDAQDAARTMQADCIVAIGGGSTIGLAKALAIENGLPILAVPSTYSGSEMTSIYGITENGIKKTGKDPRALPRTVIYDPSLTLKLPFAVSVVSGMNAIAHAAEGLYAKDGNPVLALMAEEGIRAMASGLRQLSPNTSSLAARSQCLYGAWLCGMVLAGAGMALHHKLCHTVAGSFDLPHAQTHSIVLPHAIAYNAPAAPEAMQRIARALGQDGVCAAGALYDLAQSLGAPMGLQDIGMRDSDVDRAADIAIATPYWNPRPIERDGIRTLLQAAFEGQRPA
ncbi:MAG: maleylacetate reductase [Advenella sp.]|uniref:maleylacetate reductase n=1 Tax=Advenella kashmirensis TaxID=310575 RepID=A0A356LAU2_9BURK|nr:maleylacetate reductase [Advenella sp. FME57]HBP28116.1 maleylacetate reductase [Advenella kashmirensis]